MTIVNGFLAKATRPDRFRRISETGIYNKNELVECSMRSNQAYVYQHHRNDQFCIIREPPGAGKSTTIKYVHGYDLRNDPRRKLIIAVPQTLIEKTFRRVLLNYSPIDKFKLQWDVGYNLCDGNEEQKVAQIVKFLKTKKFPQGIHERIMVCTHRALAMAYKRISDDPKLSQYLRHLTVVIDEAHHILYAEDIDAVVANEIGKLTRYILRGRRPTTKLWFCTATFFRGDRFSIIPEKDLHRFKKHFLPFDEHWRDNLYYIKTYAYDFVSYKHHPFNEVRKILRGQKHKRKTIGFCPPANHALAKGCKYTFLKDTIKAIRSVWKDANILDLVTEAGREERKAILADEKQAHKIDVVLAVRILDEGVDWPDAEQIFDFTPSNSLRIVDQRFGRLIRDKKGKSHLHYFVFLPFCTDQLDEEGYRLRLSENFAAFTASLLLEDSVRPVPVISVESKADHQSNGGSGRIDYLLNAFPDENIRRAIFHSCIEALLELKGESDEYGLPLSMEEVQQTIEQVLATHGAESHLTDMARQVALRLRCRFASPGFDVRPLVRAGFDKIWKDSILDGLMGFVSGFCDLKTFKEFRETMQSLTHRTWDDAYDQLVQWGKEDN